MSGRLAAALGLPAEASAQAGRRAEDSPTKNPSAKPLVFSSHWLSWFESLSMTLIPRSGTKGKENLSGVGGYAIPSCLPQAFQQESGRGPL